MSVRVTVKPELLRWACERSGRDMGYLRDKFKKLPDWESGRSQPTMKQLEDFAKKTYTPVGCLFLEKPPADVFATEVIRAAKEGRVSFRDAYRMTGLYGKTFDKYGGRLGFEFT